MREEGRRGRKRARRRGGKRMKRTRVRERDVMTQRKISNSPRKKFTLFSFFLPYICFIAVPKASPHHAVLSSELVPIDSDWAQCDTVRPWPAAERSKHRPVA